jgi:hypothetical protein
MSGAGCAVTAGHHRRPTRVRSMLLRQQPTLCAAVASSSRICFFNHHSPRRASGIPIAPSGWFDASATTDRATGEN